MKLSIRTVWMEIGAGFHLLFAGVAVYALRDGISLLGYWSLSREKGAVLMLLAACAVFLLHPTQAFRGIRKGLFLFAGAAALQGSAWFLAAGSFGLAALQTGYAAWLIAAAFLPCCDRRISSTDETRARGIYLMCGAVAVSLAARALSGDATAYWHSPLAIAWAFSAGVAIIWIEVRGIKRERLAALLSIVAAFLYYGIAAFASGDAGTGISLIVSLCVLMLSVTLDERLPEAADDLSGTTQRQREAYIIEITGEAIIWMMAVASVAVVNFTVSTDLRLFFGAILLVAIVTLYSYRLRPATKISQHRYLLTLVGIIISSLMIVHSIGGALGPTMGLTYLAIFGSMLSRRPIWSIGASVIYTVYVLAEFFWHCVTSHQGAPLDGHAARYIFLAASLLCSGIYTAWVGSRQVKTEEALYAVNRRLAESLRFAIRERERFEQQTKDSKLLNESLYEMRSALMNVLEDVEDSKRLIETERRRETASFNALTEGIISADNSGRIFLCNPAAALIIGVPIASIIGQTIERVLRLFEDDGAVMQTRAFEDAYAGRSAELGDGLRLKNAAGVYVSVTGHVAPYLDESSRTAGIVVVFRDVTIERDFDRQKSDFISISSHQLRTPISALRWSLDLLLGGDMGALKPGQKEYLADMSVSVVRMAKLIGDLLDISRIESGQITPKPKPVDSRTFVESVVREFLPLARRQKVKLTSSVADNAMMFYADQALARQALVNIIDNAVKYTDVGGSVSVNVTREGQETVLTVKDTGFGISLNQRHRIFDKFFRAENAVSQETIGSGLGLYMAKTAVILSGGRIRFDSEEKKGTTFYLSFPNVPEALPDVIPKSGTKRLPSRMDGGTLSA